MQFYRNSKPSLSVACSEFATHCAYTFIVGLLARVKMKLRVGNWLSVSLFFFPPPSLEATALLFVLPLWEAQKYRGIWFLREIAGYLMNFKARQFDAFSFLLEHWRIVLENCIIFLFPKYYVNILYISDSYIANNAITNSTVVYLYTFFLINAAMDDL